MSENKRYYWLKLNENFFDDDTISFIEEQENGKEYCLFYLKLCLKSVKTNGSLYRIVGETFIPYDPKTLAKITNTNIDVVKVAMDLFQKLGIVQIKETGEIYLTQINEMIGTETQKAKYMREKRAVNKIQGNNVTPLLPDCYTDIDIDIEKDIDKDINSESIDNKRTPFPEPDEIKPKTKKSKNKLLTEEELDEFWTSYKYDTRMILDGISSRMYEEHRKIDSKYIRSGLFIKNESIKLFDYLKNNNRDVYEMYKAFNWAITDKFWSSKVIFTNMFLNNYEKIVLMANKNGSVDNRHNCINQTEANKFMGETY